MTIPAHNFDDEFIVNTTTYREQGRQAITSLHGGGGVVVWVDSSAQNTPDSSDIRGQLFDSQGVPVGPEFVVNTFTSDTQGGPSVTALPEGGFVAVWYSIDSATLATSVRGQIFSPEGLKAGPEIVLTGAPPPMVERIEVAVLDGGEIVAVWTTSGYDSSTESAYVDVVGQVFDKNGILIGPHFIVNATSAGHRYAPTITALANDGFAIAWTEPNPGIPYSSSTLKVQSFDGDANKVGPELSANTTNEGLYTTPDMAPTMDGGFVLVWVNYANDIVARLFDSNGIPKGGEFVVNAQTWSGYQADPHVAVMPSGHFVVAWTDWDDGMDIRAQYFRSDGTRVGDEFAVSDMMNTGQDPVIAALDNGRLMAVWRGEHSVQYDGSSTAIVARAFSLTLDGLYGTSGPDSLGGTIGNDQIYGLEGDDTLVGAGGNDRLDGGLGADHLYGENGDDTYVVDNLGDTISEVTGEGTDAVETSLGVATGVQQQRLNAYVLPNQIENLIGTVTGQGLRGNNLDNVVTAGAGADYIHLIDGGSDNVSSGDGRDVLYYGSALDPDDANDAGDEGSDTRGDLIVIQGDYSAGLTLGAEAVVDIEKFRVLKGENTSFGHDGTGLFDYVLTTVDANVAAGGLLVVQGGSLQVGETLIFNGSDETDGRFQIFGGRDADQLFGGSGDDHLLGRAGDDLLIGNGGNDRLRGGLGRDILVGGGEADTYIYAPLPNASENPYTVAALESTGLNHDVFGDFNFAEDKIDLLQAVASLAEVLTGALSIASFDADLAAAIDGALQANGAVLFTADAGDRATETFLVIDADGNGAYQANLDFVMELENSVGAVPATPDFFI